MQAMQKSAIKEVGLLCCQPASVFTCKYVLDTFVCSTGIARPSNIIPYPLVSSLSGYRIVQPIHVQQKRFATAFAGYYLKCFKLSYRVQIGRHSNKFYCHFHKCGGLAHTRNQTFRHEEFLTRSAHLRLCFANELL